MIGAYETILGLLGGTTGTDEKPKEQPREGNDEMEPADERIRVSEAIKRRLDRLKDEDESYDDVLQRLLTDDRDFRVGFGVWSDEQADRVREARERRKRKAERRMRGTCDE